MGRRKHIAIKKNEHDWLPVSTKMVVVGKDLHTPVICSKCGITGKIFFPSTIVTIDNAKFIKAKHLKCNG